MQDNLNNLYNFIDAIYSIEDLIIGNVNLMKFNDFYDGYYTENYVNLARKLSSDSNARNLLTKVHQRNLPIASKYGKIVDSVYKFNQLKTDFKDNLTALNSYFNSLSNKFKDLKTKFLEEFYYFAKIAKGCGKILTMIYFCLLLIVTTFACISMMFYACLRRQGYLSTFMHVLWNIIRFFIFSFFFYGAAYGMCYLALRDAVAYVMFVFGEDNLDKLNGNSKLIPLEEGKDYLNYCLINSNSDYKKKLDITLTSSLEDFFKSYSELVNLFEEQKTAEDLSQYENSNDALKKLVEAQKDMYNFIKEKITNIVCKNNCAKFPELAIREGGLFGSFNCTFLKSDLNMMYRTLFDLSVEARILCALSCCIGFFGAIAIYFFLLVLHHYNTEIFFDAGKSIFTGFDRIGNNKKKYTSKDPAYKKRKIRSEIELSSRNEEYSGYQPANKGEN